MTPLGRASWSCKDETDVLVPCDRMHVAQLVALGLGSMMLLYVTVKTVLLASPDGDAQHRLLWRDKADPAHMYLITSPECFHIFVKPYMTLHWYCLGYPR